MTPIFRGLGVLCLLASANAMADIDPHFVGTMGISGGGSTLSKIQYTNGDTTRVTAGGMFYIAAGPSFEFRNTPWSVQALLGYQTAMANATNGTVKFDRTTLDGQVFYRFGNHRVGLGVVHHFAPEYSQNGDNIDSIDAKFDDATGASIEYNYLPVGGKIGVSLRGVLINYNLKTVNNMPANNASFSGNQIAAGIYLYL